MQNTTERETKLEVPEEFSLARAPRQFDAYLASAPELQRLHTLYYDTDDFRLMRWGAVFGIGEGKAGR